MGFEEARSRLMLRARGRSRRLGVRVKAQNAVTEPRGELSVGVSGGRANTRPKRRSQGLGGGAMREPSANKRVKPGLREGGGRGWVAWLRGGASRSGLASQGGETPFCARGGAGRPQPLSASARASRSSGLKIQPTSEIFRGPKVTWRGSGQCSPRTAGPSLA